MKIFLIGATGGTGREVMAQAIARGHQVTAFGRSPDAIKERPDGLTVVKGDPTSASELTAAMPGHNAVISALGPRTRGLSPLLGDSARVTIEAMKATGVRRLLVVSAAVLFENGGPMIAIGRMFLSDVVKNSTAMEAAVMASGLDWTISRPPRLTDGPATPKYRAETNRLPRFGYSISRADTARYLLDAIEQHRDIGAIVGVAH